MEKVFATRKIARNVARARMRKQGIVHPNKPRYTVRHGMLEKLDSYFASNWRRFSE